MRGGSVLTEDKQGTVLFWEKIFAVTGLFLSTNAVIPLLRKENGVVFDPFQGDFIIQVFWAGIYLITFFLLLKHLKMAIHIAFLEKLLWLLVGLAFASILWSGAPLVTFRRSVALIGTTAFGIYLATRYTKQELLKMLVWTFGIIAVLSIGFVLLLPSYGIHPKPYLAWRGVYENKNILGCFMALAAITWLLYSFSTIRMRMVGLIFCFMSIVLLFLSESITALVVFFLLLVLLFVVHMICCHKRWANRIFIFIFLTIGSLVSWIVNNMGAVLNLLGRDATLSGRTVLWQAVWDMIMQRPWLGYGYSAFWLGWKGPSSYIWSVFPSKVPHAHNGYLDLWLQLGLVGLLLFTISLFACLFKAYFLVRERKGSGEMFPFVFFLFVMIYNITESFILVQNSVFWILYVAVSIHLSIEYKKARSKKN